MKFDCVDNETREFELVQDKLIRHGFDPVLLERDEGQISISTPPNTTFWDAVKLARQGIQLPSYIYHWSRRSKRINPVSFSIEAMFNDVRWISFLPSIEVEKETSLFGRIGFLTFVSRGITKFVRLQSLTKDIPVFRTMIFGQNVEKFKFNYGYRVIGIHRIGKNDDEFLLVRDEEESTIAISPSLIGFTNKVMISSYH
jgi:hypothetical protein